jgi:hypothetical protein
MASRPRWLNGLDSDKRQWLLDHEGAPLPPRYAEAIIAAGGPATLAAWQGGGWSWDLPPTGAGPAH